MTMGVYCIQLEKKNYWRSYVGISKNIEQRWREHKNCLRGNYHDNKYLQQSWNKYEEDRFEFHILEEVDNYDELYELEKEYAHTFGYGERSLCFNIGAPGEINGWLGRKHTEKSKQKMREAQRGKKLSEEHKQKLSEAQKGEKNHNFGKKFSEETKRKMSKALRGEKSSNAKLTEEQARFILAVKTTRKNQTNSDFKQQELADYFEVTLNCIRDIMQRRRWQHIEPLSIEEYEKFKENLKVFLDKSKDL